MNGHVHTEGAACLGEVQRLLLLPSRRLFERYAPRGYRIQGTRAQLHAHADKQGDPSVVRTETRRRSFGYRRDDVEEGRTTAAFPHLVRITYEEEKPKERRGEVPIRCYP